jgi:putative toxin-antitoxin system antitoxin component (TIGR02293 family)
MVKSGLPAEYVKVLSVSLRMPIERFYRTTGLVRPTVDRKIRSSGILNQDESERVMGIARLVGQAQSLVRDSGEGGDFDAGQWVGDWLERPLPALGGKLPREFMDTVDGREIVSDLLSQQQSGTYG